MAKKWGRMGKTWAAGPSCPPPSPIFSLFWAMLNFGGLAGSRGSGGSQIQHKCPTKKLGSLEFTNRVQRKLLL
eukprot:5247642-Amphidinium_carterae.1